MRQEIRNKLKERRENEFNEQLNKMISDITAEGYQIQFGEIGNKTTYALLTKDGEEILGYTFIKDLKYKNEVIGKYKALQQAVTRKSVLENSEKEISES